MLGHGALGACRREVGGVALVVIASLPRAQPLLEPHVVVARRAECRACVDERASELVELCTRTVPLRRPARASKWHD